MARRSRPWVAVLVRGDIARRMARVKKLTGVAMSQQVANAWTAWADATHPDTRDPATKKRKTRKGVVVPVADATMPAVENT